MPVKKIVEAINSDNLPESVLRAALNTVNLIKLKRNGVIKGRTCANGSSQRKYLKDFESVASPTVSLEVLFILLFIDVYEERDIAMFDVQRAYLHELMPKDKIVLLKLKGRFVEIMCQINLEYPSL